MKTEKEGGGVTVAETVRLGAAGEEAPPLTIIRIGYETDGVPQFLEVRSSRRIDARALRLWLEARIRARCADLRIVETQEV